ncbi:MAG: hypothetical protein KDJ36_19175, partial [Hyphomicrobiaceae bacterium]|nr:hypothetical protein [Hyphomicrobiaceae bacterium]
MNPQRIVDDALGRAVSLFGRSKDEVAPTTRGVTADTIRVGGIVSATIVEQELFTATCDGARARFERANRTDELSRSIEIVGCHDDGADPAI